MHNFRSMEWIFHIGIAQSVFSAFLLLTKRRRSLADRILAVWMIFIGLELWHMLLEISGSPLHNYTSNFGFYSLTFGPFLYLYVTKLTEENSRFDWSDLWHFAPYIVLSLIHLIFFTNRPIVSDDIEMESGWFILVLLRVVVLFFSLSAYSLLSLRIIRRHQKALKESFSYESTAVTLSWLKRVTMIFIATYVMLIINMLAGNLANELLNSSHFIPAIGLTFFCFSLSYYGFNQPQIVQHSTTRQIAGASTSSESLDDYNLARYADKIRQFMETDKPYLNPELTITILSEQVKMPRHYISEVLKRDLNKNFFTLINDYRLNEVKQKLMSEEFKNESLLQIAFDSGFNSKSSFNALFKQHTGMTPSQFRQSSVIGN